MYRGSRGVLIRAVHLKFSKTNYDVIFGEEKKFRQRLVATAEGPFSTVRLITRPARRQEANRVHTLV